MSVVYLLTGSNQGNRKQNLYRAVHALNEFAGEVSQVSSIYESPAWGFDHPDDFLNQAIALNTELSPYQLLDKILQLEANMGRTRNHKGYEARIIDIDILLYDELILQEEHLIIPHPRLEERRFALTPLAEIAAKIVHPKSQTSIQELLEICYDNSQVHLFMSATVDDLNIGEECDAI
jgi:2-amino-4-hydroxy-6-hydroxymethyldihydropteridine diphosphokinase